MNGLRKQAALEKRRAARIRTEQEREEDAKVRAYGQRLLAQKREELPAKNNPEPIQTYLKISRERKDLQYQCPTCLEYPLIRQIGTSFIRDDCSCQRKVTEKLKQEHPGEWQRPEKRFTYIWLKLDYTHLEKKSFSGQYDKTFQPEAFGLALVYIKDAIEAMRKREAVPNLVTYGDPGVGKTHLVAALLNGFEVRGYSGLYATLKDYIDAINAASFEDKPKIRARGGRTDILVLDELDKASITDATKNELHALLNLRYVAGLPTLLIANTDNLNPWFLGPTVDRLEENLLKISMFGQSYRKKLRELRKERNA